MPARRKWLALAGFVVLCLAVGGIAGWATSGSIDSWYRTIAKPDWTPPDWVFGPAWTTLYILMAIAAWRIWLTGGGFNGAARTRADLVRHPAGVQFRLVVCLLYRAVATAWS
jgi:tryptophan-rich sensory protein